MVVRVFVIFQGHFLEPSNATDPTSSVILKTRTLTCANNCLGVDPNSVIIGGGAVLAASALGGQAVAGLLGIGAVAAGGAVGAAGVVAANNGNQCPVRRPCRVSICSNHWKKKNG